MTMSIYQRPEIILPRSRTKFGRFVKHRYFTITFPTILGCMAQKYA